MAGAEDKSTENVLSRIVRGPKMRLAGFPPMDTFCHTFASITATKVRAELRPGIDVSVYGFEVTRHGDYLRALFAPSAIYILGFPEKRGFALTKAHPRLLGKVLDIYLGGDGSFEESNFARSLTAIDLSIYGRFVDIVAGCFDDSIREHCGRSAIGMAARSRFEQQPGMVRIAPDQAEVFVIKLNFHMKDDKRGAGLDIVVPVSVLELLKRDLIAAQGQGSDSMSGEWAKHMMSEVMDTGLKLRAVIPTGEHAVGTLNRLTHGDVIELPREALSKIELRCDTTFGPATVTTGKLGTMDWAKAVRLHNPVEPEFLAPLVRRRDESDE
ncbi:MAG: FliM/FliN family flagellar motor switch protein [Pseudomonadota bacterium]